MSHQSRGLSGVYNVNPITLADGEGGALALDSQGRAILSNSSSGSTTETYNVTPPTLTNGQTSPLQSDVNGNLKVTVSGGAAAGGTSSPFTQTLPAAGTAVGFVDQNGKMQAASVAAFHAGDNTTISGGGLGLLTGGVTQIKNAQGNLDRQTEAGLDNIPALGITTGVASYSVPFIFTVAGTITVSAVAQVVTPSSMTNIFVGTVILFDTANATLTEPVVVTVATATTFSGVFTKSHGASASAKAFYYNQARDGAIGDKVAVGGLAAGMTYFVNSVTGLAEQERSAAGELDGATGNGTAIAAEYEFNGNGPVLSTGYSSGLAFDRARSLQAKGLAVAVQSAGGALNTNQITASTAASVSTLQPGQQVRIDRNTATEESAYVSQTYAPGVTSITFQSNLAFAHTGAAIEWDVFASAGPGLSGFIATGIGIEEEALYNPVDGKYYIERASTTDAMPSANIVAESGVVWNGTTFDRERAAYQDALSATGIPAEAEMLWNGATFDRAREASSDALPITGVAAEAEMLWNGTTFDRARELPTADAQAPTGFGADGIMLYNGATYDRLRGNGGSLNSTLATLLAGEDLVNNRMIVEQRFSYATTSTATTITVKSGAGFLHSFTILGGTLGAITVYDSTTGTGTPILPTFTPTSTAPAPTIIVDSLFSTGLTIVTAAATVIQLSYR